MAEAQEKRLVTVVREWPVTSIGLLVVPVLSLLLYVLLA